jgi:hypothetical protein
MISGYDIIGYSIFLEASILFTLRDYYYYYCHYYCYDDDNDENIDSSLNHTHTHKHTEKSIYCD